MDVIYCCYAGAHTSITAAALHTGLLSAGEVPSSNEIIALPQFDQAVPEHLGRVWRYGSDERGHSIYIAALGPGRKATLSALRLVLNECGKPAEEVLIVDALSCINLEVRVGGFLSRRLGLVALGRAMCARGIIRNFRCFTRLVAQVRETCHNNP